MAAANRGVVEEQNLQRMIRNLYYTRDGKSGYAMYYTFELPITFPEFSSRSRNVLVDCSNAVLEARAQTIEDDELANTAQIVQLEEDVVEDGIRALNNKQEVLESLREDLIAYKARCGRYREYIERRRTEVETRRAIEAQNAREIEEAAHVNVVQNEPMDLSRSAREEELRQHIERQHNLPVVRLQRFDQQRPQIVIRRCDAPIRQPDPVPQPPVIMAEQQPVNDINEEPEIEAVPEQQEEVMDVEVYGEDDETTDSDTGKGINLINLVTLVDSEIVKNPKRKRKRKNILGKPNGFAKRFVNKAKVIPNVRESTISKIAQSKKAVSHSKSKQDEIYTQIFENKEKQKSTLSKFKIGKKGDSGKNEINNGIEIQSVNRTGALKVIKTIDVNSIKPGHCKITFENKLREKFQKRFHKSVGNSKFVNSTDGEIDEVENAIYDQAINEFEAVQNAGNAEQNVHDWAEEVLANEIAQNVQQAQPPPENVQPEVQAQQPVVEPVVRMNPLPQPTGWNNTRFGLEAVQVLREYGWDVIVRMRLHEDRAEKAMIHLSTDVRENVYGERAIMQWSGVYTHAVGARTRPIPDIRCRLDGAPFVYTGLRRQYALRIFPYVDLEDDAFIVTGWLVPPLGHTPDFSLERVVLGEDFLRENLHSINPGLMEVTLRAENGNLVRKRYQLRHRMRN
ncbi:hypothetical protein V9T40_000921 [Parthenolecanium corni]|uniref:Uncharacterized protein n=1 Tax=Parthenolecanium corni TaxID=536013 RepID=A0AAN9TAG3_9HEMI